MNNTKFKAGDRVRIRTWEDLQNEYGTDIDGNIACPYCFAKGMALYSGAEFAISNIDGEVIQFSSSANSGIHNYIWSIYMVTLVDETFKVGDKVRIRQWDDMKAEFGMNEYGDIASNVSFATSMEEFCGMTCVISEISEDRVYFENMSYDMQNYYWTTEMIEPYEDVDINPQIDFSYESLFE